MGMSLLLRIGPRNTGKIISRTTFERLVRLAGLLRDFLDFVAIHSVFLYRLFHARCHTSFIHHKKSKLQAEFEN